MKTPELGDDWIDPNEGQCTNNDKSDSGSVSRLGENGLNLIISVVLAIRKVM